MRLVQRAACALVVAGALALSGCDSIQSSPDRGAPLVANGQSPLLSTARSSVLCWSEASSDTNADGVYHTETASIRTIQSGDHCQQADTYRLRLDATSNFVQPYPQTQLERSVFVTIRLNGTNIASGSDGVFYPESSGEIASASVVVDQALADGDEIVFETRHLYEAYNPGDELADEFIVSTTRAYAVTSSKVLALISIGSSIEAGSANTNNGVWGDGDGYDQASSTTDALWWSQSAGEFVGPYADRIGEVGNNDGSYHPEFADKFFADTGVPIRHLMAAKGSSRFDVPLPNNNPPQWGRDPSTNLPGVLWAPVTSAIGRNGLGISGPFELALREEFGPTAEIIWVLKVAAGNELQNASHTPGQLAGFFGDIYSLFFDATTFHPDYVLFQKTGGKCNGNNPTRTADQRSGEQMAIDGNPWMHLVSDEIWDMIQNPDVGTDGCYHFDGKPNGTKDKVHPSRNGNRRVGADQAEEAARILGL